MANLRIDKCLADMNIGTRSQIKEYIKAGLVTCNGSVVKKPDVKVDTDKDIICYKGQALGYTKYRYYMLHKPSGVVTATKDNHDKTVMDLLTLELRKDLFPVGRLDKDTEGLLLITNDGELSHDLLSPKKHVSKTYYVECKGHVDDEKISKLEQGIDIGDVDSKGNPDITKPAHVVLLSSKEDGYSMELTITEGRFHQVKRMIKAIDGEVTYLKRLSMGSLRLDESLPLGSYRELTGIEVDNLKMERHGH